MRGTAIVLSLIALASAKRSVDRSVDTLDVGADVDCDVDAEDYKKYGPKLQTSFCPKRIGCTFWDSCRRGEDGQCPSYCRKWKEVTPSMLFRMKQWKDRKFGKLRGTCPRYCRFTDEYMLKPVMSSAFMASSTAYLATEVPQFVEECKDIKSSMSCFTKYLEMASVTAFFSSALSKGRKLGKEGKTAECAKVLPPSLATEAGESVIMLHQFLDDVKLLPIHNPKQLELLRAAYTPDHWEKICEGSDSKDSLDETSFTDEQLKQLLVVAAKHNTHSMSDEQADAFVKEIRVKGISAVVDEKTTAEEEAMESLMAKQSTSLMQLNMNDELQVQDFIGGVMAALVSVVIRLILFALTGWFWILVCLVPGFGQEALDVADVAYMYGPNTWQTWAKPITCPIVVARSYAGIGQSKKGRAPSDFMRGSGLSWDEVGEVFEKTSHREG